MKNHSYPFQTEKENEVQKAFDVPKVIQLKTGRIGILINTLWNTSIQDDFYFVLRTFQQCTLLGECWNALLFYVFPYFP